MQAYLDSAMQWLRTMVDFFAETGAWATQIREAWIYGETTAGEMANFLMNYAIIAEQWQEQLSTFIQNAANAIGG